MDSMTPNEQRSTRSATVEHLRGSVAAHAGNRSLRRVAREIGMSATGLKKFLERTDPYFPTLRRLQTWYVKHAAGESGSFQLEDASAAINVLLHDLSPQARQGMAGRMIEVLARGYDETGTDTPVWLSDLRARHADEDANTAPVAAGTSTSL
jgi:hypothetical protein